MTLVLPDVAENRCLKAIVGHTIIAAPLVLRLYTNNVTPGESDLMGSEGSASFTEASGNGYAAKTLTAASWSVASGTASFAAQTFTFTGALGNVYGYYVTDANGLLMWAERFTGAPFAVANNGDSIVVTPSISLS